MRTTNPATTNAQELVDLAIDAAVDVCEGATDQTRQAVAHVLGAILHTDATPAAELLEAKRPVLAQDINGINIRVGDWMTVGSLGECARIIGTAGPEVVWVDERHQVGRTVPSLLVRTDMIDDDNVFEMAR